MSRYAFLLLLALACVTASVAAAPRQTDLWLVADITIDKDGKLTHLEWKDQRLEVKLITDRITPAINRWEFTPGSLDGQPKETVSSLTVGLHATENADGSVGLRFLKASTGPSMVSRPPPEYPLSALRDGVSAEVMLSLTVHSDGAPSMDHMEFLGSDGKEDQTKFQEAVGKWIAAQTFEPEKVAGTVVQTHVQIPIEFCVTWENWCSKHHSAFTPESMPRNMPVAIDSAVAIKTDVRLSKI